VVVAAGRKWLSFSYPPYLAEAYLVCGRREDTMVHGERALALTREHKEQGHEAWALRLLGAISAQRHPPDVPSAEAHYRQALTVAEALGMSPLQAHCHLGLGTLYARTGQRQQAHAALSAAITLYRALDMAFWLPQAEAVLGQVERR
jgi:tetratricopeptide (TPR) repeat protein